MSNTPTVKAVLFDVGGVLAEDMIDRKLVDLARKYAIPEDRLLAAGARWRPRADLGEISDAEFWRAALRMVGIEATLEDEDIAPYMAAIPGTLDLARQLGERLRVAILSNDSREMALARRRTFGFDAIFNPVVISSEVGAVKPDRRIYEIAAQRVGLAPAECLFVDNMQVNVDGAMSAGMRAVRFVDARQLAASLAEAGLLGSRGSR